LNLEKHLDHVIYPHSDKEDGYDPAKPDFKGSHLVVDRADSRNGVGQNPCKNDDRKGRSNGKDEGQVQSRCAGNRQRNEHSEVKHPAVGAKGEGKEDTQQNGIQNPLLLLFLHFGSQSAETRKFNSDHIEHKQTDEQQQRTNDQLSIFLEST